MATTTSTYNLQKPALNGDSGAWGGMLNDNFDKIAAALTSINSSAGAGVPAAGGTFTGPVNLHTATVARQNISTTGGVIGLDLNVAQAFTVALANAATFQILNPTASGAVAQGFVLRLNNAGSTGPHNWGSTVKWAGGSAPAFSNGTDLLAFLTFDNGASYLGVLVAADLRSAP